MMDSAQTTPTAKTEVGASSGEESPPSIDQIAINTVRTLVMDAVQKANAGHPGAPLALTPAAYTLTAVTLGADQGRDEEIRLTPEKMVEAARQVIAKAKEN